MNNERRYAEDHDGSDTHWGVTYTSSSTPQQDSPPSTPPAQRPPPQQQQQMASPSSATSPRRSRRGNTETQQQPQTPRRNTENENVEFTLRSMLPSKWNVPKNHAHVNREKNKLRLVGRTGMSPDGQEEETTVLVVTNKPIPMEVLHNIASSTTRRDPSNSRDAVDVYYFEVNIQKGITWIGLVPSNELQGPVTLGRFPGDCVGSIGMSSDGRLYISARQQHQEQGAVDMMKESTTTGFTARDTLGCGLEVAGDDSSATTRVFFTKNGEMLLAPMNVPELNTLVDWYFPAAGVASAGGDIFANFGLSYPFRWKGSDQHVLFSPDQVVEAPVNSPPRAHHPESYIPSPTKPAPGSSNASSWNVSSTPAAAPAASAAAAGVASVPPVAAGLSPGEQRRRQSVEERLEQMRREQQASLNSLMNGDRQVPPMNAEELDSKPPAVPREQNPRGGNFNDSQGSALSNTNFPQQSHESYGSIPQPRQPDTQSGRDVKLPSRPSVELLNGGRQGSAPRDSSSNSSSPRSSFASRPSLSSSGLYGKPSDRSIRLDESFPNEEEMPHFLPFPKQAPPGGEDEFTGRVGAFAVNEPAPARAGAPLMDRQDIDDATAHARHLRECCESNNISFAAELLEICRTKQDTVRRTLEEGMIKFDDPSLETQLHELMILNDTLLEEIEFAEEQLESKPAPGPDFPVPPDPDSPHLPDMRKPLSVKIDTLVNRKDVFSLICMLRAQSDERLDSALALMRFARDAEQSGGLEAKVLRDEINSSGGMLSLLALFRSKGATRELKVVVALAVAYLLPSFVQSETLPSSSIGLKIMECLRFLFTSKPVSPNGEAISRADLCHASAMGVYTFWFIALSPTLSKNEAPLGSFSESRDSVRRPSLRMRKSRAMQQHTAESVFDQRREVLELQELLELTVSLIVEMAKTSDRPDTSLQVRHSDANYVPLVEQMSAIVQQMCAIDMARPIAVREGLLKVLVMWMRSQDSEKVRCAAISVNELTSTLDSYMAGWIHSQIVNEGALMELVKLSICKTVCHDVRLAVAEILCRLCVAPHTRAAVVEAKCIRCLISLLYESDDSSSKKVAYAAGSALLQLVAGAMTRASVFSSDNFEQDESISADKRDDVISDVVNGGAIGQFVAMARHSPHGKLRSMSVEALRVLSEDSHRSRRTRLRLCENGAAGALGYIINDDVKGDGAVGSLMDVMGSDQEHNRYLSTKDTIIKELHQALCAWANILDRNDQASGSFALSFQSSSSSLIEGAEDTLVKGFIQFAEVGGLESLLFVSTLPLNTRTHIMTDSLDESDLTVEACRSLASLSPLLISGGAAAKGQSAWSVVVLQALARVLSNVVNIDDTPTSELATEMKFDSLRGMGALAKYEPHKLVIVDKFLPSLFQAKATRGGEDPFYISGAANQICLSLGFSEDDFAKKIAGSDPKLMGDWFCMQRSLLIQSMARAEIRCILSLVWEKPFHDILAAGLVPAGLGRTSSKESSGSAGQHSNASSLARSESSGEIRALEDVFEALMVDTEGSDAHNTVLQQYHDVYEQKVSQGQDAFFSEVIRSWKVSVPESDSILASHVYPLNSTSAEKEWMLSHRRFMKDAKRLSLGSSENLISDRVQNLMDSCIPSKLIQQHALPVFDLRPESSFEFRSLLMPQRRYFSFRREGQLVAQLCERNTSFVGSDDDIYWTLGFTNSSFAGEFSETLVQSLYRCPMIRGISFTKNDSWRSVWATEGEDEGQVNSTLLANLAGSLPPWVSSITYDNTLNDHALSGLALILETMGRLSASQADDNRKEPAQLGQKQGSFQSFAVRNSPHLGSETWNKFFDLLGRSPERPSLKAHPLASLRVLDLSGNELGDLSCSIVLARALGKESGCCLEQLDLSRNSIRQGKRVARVLRSYVNTHRANQNAGIYVSTQSSWKASLAYLNLGSNELTEGGLALEVADLLKHNALSLKSLDLSENGLGSKGFQFTEVLLGSLVKNTSLRHLNLSGNEISSQCIDGLLGGLNRSETGSSLAFLRLQDNRPPLTTSQRDSLNAFVDISRKLVLERYLKDRERMKSGELENIDVLDDGPMPLLPEDEPSYAKRPSLERDVSEHSASLFSGTASTATDESPMRRLRKGENMITVLFSAPLVFQDEHKKYHPFAKLDFDMERELLWQCLKEARRDIELFFDNATTNRLLTAKTKRCSCLHYSGHGHETHLPFEDERGGPHWVEVSEIRELIEQNEGAPFKFVFVSACHSYLAGETFASAGVPHVVCCQQESELKDAAALAFTRQFYLALAVGDTVQDSFHQGCKAVRATPNLRNAEEEMKKFILLPRNGKHNVPIFDARPVREWPRTAAGSSRNLHRSKSRRRSIPQQQGVPRSRSIYGGGSRSSELSVRNMMQEDPSPTPPQFFIGREVDMYHVLNAVLTKRLVSVVGEKGVGRSSLVYALCHYVNERRSTIMMVDHIFFVRAAQNRGSNRFVAVLRDLLKKQIEAGRVAPQGFEDMDRESLIHAICKALNKVKALLVIDRTEFLAGSDEQQDLIVFLKELFQETRTKHVRVLLTGREPLGIPSIGGVSEYPYTVGPMNFQNTVRLFGNVCPHLHTPADRQRFVKRLVTNEEQAQLLPTDEANTDRIKFLFHALGDGIPSRIENAAHSISRDSLERLGLVNSFSSVS